MNMIFHMPENFLAGNSAGPTVRPRRFLKAFKDKGYDVFLIAGTLEDRIEQVKKLSQEIADGKKFDFMYSESSSYPTLWTETKKSLFGPRVDYKLFKICKKNSIPVGFYLRDIYWVSDQFKSESSLIKRVIFTLLHEIDLLMYKKYSKKLYLQSKLMGSHLPHSTWFDLGVLPPGTDELPIEVKKSDNQSKLNLFYVGGIGSHYDMEKLFLALAELQDKVEMTLCCRLRDYERYFKDYMDLPNVTFIHKDASELKPYLEEADITLLYFHPGEYRKFVMPNKLYEYLGARTPILTNNDTEAGRYITENKLGWAIDYDVEVCRTTLEKLANNRNEIMKIAINVEKVLYNESWTRRVEQVIEDLAVT